MNLLDLYTIYSKNKYFSLTELLLKMKWKKEFNLNAK